MRVCVLLSDLSCPPEFSLPPGGWAISHPELVSTLLSSPSPHPGGYQVTPGWLSGGSGPLPASRPHGTSRMDPDGLSACDHTSLSCGKCCVAQSLFAPNCTPHSRDPTPTQAFGVPPSGPTFLLQLKASCCFQITTVIFAQCKTFLKIKEL